MEGAPESVGGGFSCSDNKLTSLEGAPSHVGGDFVCRNNQLTSLEGAPSHVGGDFDFDNNNLTSLEGLLWKSFKHISLVVNPIYPLVDSWINKKNRDEFIEYFLDMNIIQVDKVILPRLKAFHVDLGLEMNIDFDEVKKHYEIIK